VGWECEVEVEGHRTGERRLADTYLVAEVASDSNDIVRLRAWDAASIRPLLIGKPSHDRGNPGWTHGLRLNLNDPDVGRLATDLTPRLW